MARAASRIANREAKRQSDWRRGRGLSRHATCTAPDTMSYSVVTTRGGGETPTLRRSGMSHPDAMLLAEELRREGCVVVVLHVIGGKSYEVDRYPAR